MDQSNDVQRSEAVASRREQLRVAGEIDSICDAFEKSWQQGESPSVSDFLKSHISHGLTDQPTSTLFVELVKIDLEYRGKQGEKLDIDSYAEFFPEYRDLLTGLLPAADDEATAIRPLQEVKRIGRFLIEGELGTGTFGTVRKAWDELLERHVAIKEFKEGVSRHSLPLLQREARAVAKLNHPNVVQVLELSDSLEGKKNPSEGEGADKDFIVFEFVEGLNLKVWQEKRMGGAQVPPDEVARFGVQMARGLQHVHEQGLVHRDFKPTNVLITPSGQAKIVDFGLARHMDSLTTISRDKSIMGTVPYMSPEQCRAEPVTAATDIYSLGVILYELLTGRRPFSGSRNEMLQSIQHVSVTPPSDLADVPDAMEHICLQALEKKPEYRYQSAKDLADDLERFLAGEEVSASALARTVTLPRSTVDNDLHMETVRTGSGEAATQSRRGFLSWAAGSAMFAGLGSAALLLNREPNDGKKVALVRTEPPGANVAFVPVDPVSGDVIPSELEHASGVTPLRHRLRPATYLVVVYFEDDSTRFHEAYRKIPVNSEDNYGGLRHLSSRILENGDIQWSEIEIPDPTSFSDMAKVDGPASFYAGIAGSTISPPAVCTIPGFLIDPIEYTVADYCRATKRETPWDLRSRVRVGPQQAVNISWNEALTRAESAGKRLLHEFEYEYVATAFGKHAYPWGDELPEGFADLDHLGDVGTLDFDRLQVGDIEVRGLFSNVAEWVQTTIPLYPEQEAYYARATAGDHGVCGVRGFMVPEGIPVPREPSSPRQRASVGRTTIETNLGFRCGRSLTPRLRPEDFVSYQSASLPNQEFPSLEHR